MQTGSIRLWQRVLAVLCAVAMLLVTFPQGAYTAFAEDVPAAETTQEQSEPTELSVTPEEPPVPAEEPKAPAPGAADDTAGTTGATEVKITGISFSDKTYDGSTTVDPAAAVYTLDHAVEGATISGLTFTLDNKNVGTRKVTVDGTPSISVNDATETYTVALALSSTPTIKVTKKPVTITNITFANAKTYDGSTAVDPEMAAYTFDPEMPDGTKVTGLTFTLDNKNASATPRNVTVSETAEIKNEEGNYEITVADTVKPTIQVAPKPVTITNITFPTKTYDEKTTVDAATAVYTFDPEMPAETKVTGLTFAMDTPDVGTDKAVNITAASQLEIEGEAGNYTVTLDPDLAPKIEVAQKVIFIKNIKFNGITYDGTTNIDENTQDTAVYTLEPDIEGATISGLTFTRETPNAGTQKVRVDSTNLAISGVTGNYTVALDPKLAPTIEVAKKPVTITNITFPEKTYDGTTTLTEPTITLSEPDLTVTSGLLFSIEDKNVAYDEQRTNVIAKKVNVEIDEKGVVLSNDNYELSSIERVTAEILITPKPLNVEEITFNSRLYNGKADVAEQMKITDDRVEGDDILYTGITCEMKDANAGTGKKVKVDWANVTLEGEDAKNYSGPTVDLSPDIEPTIDIGKVPLRVTQNSDQTISKDSDGTTDVPDTFAAKDYFTVQVEGENAVDGETPYVMAVCEEGQTKVKGMAYADSLPGEDIAINILEDFAFKVYLPGENGGDVETENYQAQWAEDASVKGNIKSRELGQKLLDLGKSTDGKLVLSAKEDASEEKAAYFAVATHKDGDENLWFKAGEAVKLDETQNDNISLTEADGEKPYTVTMENNSEAGESRRLENIYINADGVVYGPLTITYNYDDQAPAINLTDVKLVSGTADIADELGVDFDASNSALIYTIEISDNLSGVKADTVYYAVTNTTEPEETEWKEAAATRTEDDHYTIKVAVPAKGKTVHVKAQDYAGNENQASMEKPLVVENTAPKINEFKANMDKPAKSPTFTLDVDDSPNGEIFSGIAKIVYKAVKTKDGDGNTVTDDAGQEFGEITHTGVTFDTIANCKTYSNTAVAFEKEGETFADGTYDVTVTVYDFCGNSAQRTINGVIIDNTAPKAKIVMGKTAAAGDGNFYYKGGAAQVTITLTDTNMQETTPLTYMIQVDGNMLQQDATTSTGTINLESAILEGFGEGSHTLTLSVKDVAENESQSVDMTFTGMKQDGTTGAIIIDTIAPKAAIVMGKTEAAGDGNFYYKSGSAKVDIGLTDTNMQETTPLTYTIQVDGRTLQQDATTSTGTITLESSVLEGFGEGTHTLTLSVKDVAENESQSVDMDFAGMKKDGTAGTIIIDTIAPKATIVMGKTEAASNGNFYYKRDDAKVDITLTDTNMRETTPLTYTIQVDGNMLQQDATTSAGTITLESSVLEGFGEGTHTLTLSVKDVAENESQSADMTFTGMKQDETTGTVILDFTVPVVYLKLDGTNEVDGGFYSNAGNCGITVTVTDTNVGATGELADYSVSIDDKKAEKNTVDGEVRTLTIDAGIVKDLTNGDKTIKVTAVDAAGNQAAKMKVDNAKDNGMQAEFNLDTHAPELIKVQSTAPKNDKIYDEGVYYTFNRANILNVTYTIADDPGNNNYHSPYTTLTVMKNNAKITAADGTVKINDTDGTITADIAIVENVAGDVYSFEITAEDKAKNPLKLVEGYSIEERDKQTESKTGTFTGNVNKIVDTVAPEAVIDYNVTDSTSVNTDHYYKEGEEKRAYYSAGTGEIKASFTVSDENGIDPSRVTIGEEKKAAESIGVEITATEKVNKDLTETEDGDYRFYIYGLDKAGNALTVFEHKKESDTATDTVGSPEHGDEAAKYLGYPKTLDRVVPTVDIRFTNDPGDEYRDDDGYAYYNKDIQVEYTFNDNHGLDETRVYTGYDSTVPSMILAEEPVGENVKENQDQTDSVVAHTIKADFTAHGTDGHYNFKAWGEDKAGNPLTVTEYNTQKADAKALTTTGQSTGYRSAFDKVMDTINPVVFFKVGTDAKNKELRTEYNNRYYLNAPFTATYTVKDTNYVEKYITAKYGYVAEPGDNMTAAVSPESAGNGKFATTNGTGTADWTFGSNGQGIYILSLSGRDLAGNKVVLDGEATAELANNPIQKQDNNTLISYVMAVDQSVPTVDITVGDYYEAKLNGDANYSVKENAPYRKETQAKLDMKGYDVSPLDLQYTLVSSINNGKEKRTEGTYVHNAQVSHTFSGEQVFAINYLQATDLAGNISTAPVSVDGNVSNYIYLDVTPPVEDRLAPTVALVAHESGVGRSTEGVDLYDGTVTVEARISDPGFKDEPHDAGGTSSGLYRLYYEVLQKENGDWTGQMDGKIVTLAGGEITAAKGIIQYADGPEHKGAENEKLKGKDTVTFTFDAETFNYNDITLRVWVEDNTGNRSSGTFYTFGIDTTAPTIEVSYDNNDAQNEKYFKADRTATVVVTERNFNPDATEILTESTASVGSWSYAAGGAKNGDDDTWTCQVSYTQDGDYTFDVHTKDLAGHDAGEADYGSSVAPREFVIDKTNPVIEISFDNNDVRNGKYYKDVRTATIRVEEHNFSADGATVTTTASIAEGNVSAPGVGSWGTSGDSSAAQVPFTSDGDYTMHVEYVDLAGNEAEPEDVDEFTVDTTAPELEIGGVEDRMAYNGDVAPSITYHDINYDNTSAGVSITGYKHPEGSNLTGSRTDDAFGGSFVCDNIEVVKENDDVYTATGSVSDLAGNTTEETVTFSVNRFGSTYILSKETQTLVDGYYTNTPQALHVTEINVSPLEKQEITTSLNGEVTTLRPDTDYTVQSANPGWMQYDYTIQASNFEKEGAYTVTLYSEDMATNSNTNRAVKGNAGETNELPIDFLVDMTAPVTLITGVEDNERYVDTQRTLVVHYDDNTAVAGLTLYINNQKTAEYDGEELAKMGGELQYVANASNDWQVLRVVSVDVAGNQTETNSGRFLLTDNLWVQYINNKPLLFGSIGLLALLFILILLFKRKKDKDEEQKKQKV